MDHNVAVFQLNVLKLKEPAEAASAVQRHWPRENADIILGPIGGVTGKHSTAVKRRRL